MCYGSAELSKRKKMEMNKSTFPKWELNPQDVAFTGTRYTSILQLVRYYVYMGMHV